jgi:hypothetical protein
MMRGRFRVGGTALLLAATGLAHPVLADPDGEVVQEFGLTGHWAIACDAAPSPYNPHIFVSTSDTGQAIRRRVTGDPRSENTIPLLNARLLGNNQLTMQQFVEGKTVTFLLVMDQDRYRIDEMVTSDGKLLVTHAVQNFDGKESPWYHRCP